MNDATPGRSIPTRIRAYIREVIATRPRDPWLLFALAICLVFSTIGLRWGLPNFEPWNTDTIGGIRVLKVVHTYFDGSHKYPYFHWWLSLIFYAPYMLYWVATGQYDPGCWPVVKRKCFEMPNEQLGQLILVSRLISVVMALGIVYLIYRIAQRMGAGIWGARLSALITSMAYGLCFYAHTSNLDVPVTFWLTLSLLAMVDVAQQGRFRDYLLFGISAGLALGTKDALISAYVFPGIAILWLHFQRARGRIESGLDHESTRDAKVESDRSSSPSLLRRFFDKRMLGLMLAVLIIYGLSMNVVFNWEGFATHWKQWLPGFDRMTGFQDSTRDGIGHKLLDIWIGTRSAIGTPWAILGLLGLPSLYRRYPRATVLIGLSSLSFIVTGLIPSGIIEVRMSLVFVPLLAVSAGMLAEWLISSERQPLMRNLARPLLVLALLYTAQLTLSHLMLFPRDARYQTEDFIRQTIEPGASIAVFSHANYLPRFYWMDYDFERIESDEEIDYAQEVAQLAPEYLVLSERWFERYHSGPRAEFFEALLAGQLGYEIVWDHEGGLPWSLGLEEVREASTSIDPRQVVLKRKGP